MKRKIIYSLSIFLVILTGCSTPEKSNDTTTKERTSPSTNAAVLYFSKPEMNGTDTVAGASRVVSENEEILGNVEQLAKWIVEDTNYPLARIETVNNYPDDHDTLVDQATSERSNNYRPEIKPLDLNLSDFDTIYIGYPIWWSDMPMAMYTFFENNNFKGKNIVLFSVHGGSGLAGTVETVEKLSENASVETSKVLSISRDDIPNSKKEVENWLKSF